MKEKGKLISIAIPCYKSAHIIEDVVFGIVEQFETHREYDYEIVLVNDGSPDNTFEVIHRICSKNRKVTGVNLSKNFGQSAAKMAAINYVHGDYLVYMDDDGQHPAEGIFSLVEKIDEGYDIVYAHFLNKKHNLFKRVTSKLHNSFLTHIGSKPKGVNISSFLAMSRFCIEAMKTSGCPVIAVGAYLRRLTNRVTNIYMPHFKRKEGKSGYSFKRLFKLWKNSITSFNTTLLNYSMIAGYVCGGVGLLFAAIIIVRKLVNPHIVIGYASIMSGMLILSGLLMFFINILGDYVGKIYLILCGLPPFKVRDVIGKDGIELMNVSTDDNKNNK